MLNHFDNGYKKLTNLKDKKTYMRDIVDKTNLCVCQDPFTRSS